MVTVAGANLIELKNGSSTVNTANYTDNDGVITIKKEYLATLTTGDKTFTFVTDTGGSPAMTITVSDTTE